MTTPRDLDSILAAWVDEGPTRLPADTRRAILVSTRTTRQQRRLRWLPWRTSMLSITRVAILAMVIAIVGPIGLNLIGSGALFSPGPIDTSDWTTYVSDGYGFSVGHPAGWTERPADHTWTLAADTDWLSSASEGFEAPGNAVLVTAWSVAIQPETDRPTGAWIATYCHLNTMPCAGLEDRTIPVTMDGYPGSLLRSQDDIQAFILVGDRMYVAAVWEPDSDPRVAPYGGATRLLEAYLSTMHLLPGGAATGPSAARSAAAVPIGASLAPMASPEAIDTSTWTPFESERYGFGLSHPADRTAIPAAHDWTMAEAADWLSHGADAFRTSEGEGICVSAWTAPVAPGVTTEAWIEA